MKTLLILISILISLKGFSQFRNNKALFKEKRGLIFQSRTLIIPEDNLFILEQYTYGGGIFNDFPYRDTLILKGDTLLGKFFKFSGHNGKYFTINKKGKKSPIRFKEMDICDSEVNSTRNWTYKERLRYMLNDSIYKYFGSFHRDIDFGYKEFEFEKSYSVCCYKLYTSKADSLFKCSLDSINNEYSKRAKRFSDFSDSKIVINEEFINIFLRDFVSCKFDQEIFYDLILNNIELLISQINLLSSSEYHQLTYQLMGMPPKLDPKPAIQIIKDSKMECRYRDNLIKDIKMYWR